MSLNRWVDKTTVGYLLNGVLLGHKKENFNFWDSIDGSEENYATCNKLVRGRQIPYDFTHMESNKQTELTSKIERDS